MSSAAIGRAVRAGRLIPVHLGVYAVGHRRIDAVAVAAAAWLACGPEDAVSHETGGALWGFRKRWPKLPEISGPKAHRRAGIKHHRTRTLIRSDIRHHRGLRVTSPARTLADIRGRLTAKQFTRAVNDARLAGLLSLGQAAALMGAAPPKNATRSSFEDDVLAAILDRGLPAPEVNVPLHGFEVDLYFRAHGVVVEIDDYRYHADPATFERERRESEVLAAARLALIRISGERWGQEAEAVLDNLTQSLQDRGFAA